MKNDHFLDSGKLIGSFVLVLLIGCALENFAGKAFGAVLSNALAVFLMAIATLAFRWLWMWVEGSNVPLSLWGKRCRLTVGSLFVCAGAFLAVSFMVSWLAWLAAPSSKEVAGYQHAKSYGGSSSSTEQFERRQEERRQERAEEARKANDRTYRIMHDLSVRDSYGNPKRCLWKTTGPGKSEIYMCE